MEIDSFGKRGAHKGISTRLRGGETRAAGVACTGPGSRPPFAGSSDAFGSYKTKGTPRFCLHSYSDFLLSETTAPVTTL
ncbi:hypothetical protein GCM10010339_87650 [Streptomyces alanosinicus]|uniref:Uncharacterized protein n=1 Tax=Streptomyces alanosinicus TaxID=68171 RepID=A0A918YSE3_9ACTN|nr:hypothetical protein GCM10010339_87650 [Streptomyces alanosinicus]